MLRLPSSQDVAELRREHDLVAAALDRLADERLVLAGLRAVDVGGVEEGDAELERPVDRRDRLGLVRLAVPGRHPHAAEALLRDLEPVSKRARFHAATAVYQQLAIVAAGHGRPEAENLEVAPRQASRDPRDQRADRERLPHSAGSRSVRITSA